MENEKEIFMVLVAMMAHALVLRGDQGPAKDIVEDATELANTIIEVNRTEFG